MLAFEKKSVGSPMALIYLVVNDKRSVKRTIVIGIY